MKKERNLISLMVLWNYYDENLKKPRIKKEKHSFTWVPAKPTWSAGFKLSIEMIHRINSSTFALRTLFGTW